MSGAENRAEPGGALSGNGAGTASGLDADRSIPSGGLRWFARGDAPAARWPSRRQSQGGFTLVELSVVLVVIAVILGAATVGGDLLRHANGQRIFSGFVTGWSRAFAGYVDLTKVPPGDNLVSPTYLVGGASGAAQLCNDPGAPALSNVFLAQGISLPEGSSTGQEDRYLYQDSNGSPHELRVCFRTVDWAVQGSSSGVYVLARRHVMQLTGLTSELAMQLDSMVDGRADARFGRLRSVAQAGNTGVAGVEWPVVRTSSGEDNIGEVPAYLEMN